MNLIDCLKSKPIRLYLITDNPSTETSKQLTFPKVLPIMKFMNGIGLKELI